MFLSRKGRRTSYCDNAGWLDDFPWGWCDLGMPGKKAMKRGKSLSLPETDARSSLGGDDNGDDDDNANG